MRARGGTSATVDWLMVALHKNTAHLTSTISASSIGFCIQAGIGYVDVPRVEVFINSSRLSSKLKVDVRLLPIRALLQSQPGTVVS